MRHEKSQQTQFNKRDRRIALFIIKNPQLPLNEYAARLNTTERHVGQVYSLLGMGLTDIPPNTVGAPYIPIVDPHQYNDVTKRLRAMAKGMGLTFKRYGDTPKWAFWRAGQPVSEPYKLVDWKTLYEGGNIMEALR